MKVTVMMPVYNGLPEIKHAIHSLLWQTYHDWECVIVDDGSTDGTGEYLDSLTDSRFKITHLEKNGGRGNARQECLNRVSGEYLAFLDADDWYAPEKLEEQVKYLDEHPTVDLISGVWLSYGTNVEFKRVRGGGDGSVRNYTGGDLKLAYPTIMMRTSIVAGKSYNLTFNYGEDGDFIKRCLFGRNYVATDKVWYYYNEFESMSIKKMRKAHLEILHRKRTLLQLSKYLYWCLVAPILGVNYRIKRRGADASEKEIRCFETLYERLLSETSDKSE